MHWQLIVTGTGGMQHWHAANAINETDVTHVTHINCSCMCMKIRRIGNKFLEIKERATIYCKCVVPVVQNVDWDRKI